ncbi:unnamed protein product [Pleuronectes platessa]|uniref:Uncharacterized protein n=1 Tax=Pleuronectes platessa TaxID=8262 RepID=A0A9N7U5G6_PLEPL|nr:unnamed protein product [Pleuronectes platessa]
MSGRLEMRPSNFQVVEIRRGKGSGGKRKKSGDVTRSLEFKAADGEESRSLTAFTQPVSQPAASLPVPSSASPPPVSPSAAVFPASPPANPPASNKSSSKCTCVTVCLPPVWPPQWASLIHSSSRIQSSSLMALKSTGSSW